MLLIRQSSESSGLKWSKSSYMMTENLNFCIRSFCLQLSKLHRHFDSKHHLPGHICGPNRMSDIPVCSLGATLSLKQSRRWK